MNHPGPITAHDLGHYEFAALQQRMARTVWRVVETQEVAATQAITRNAAEQSRLEALLDASKPAIPGDCKGLSYLLYTPFRYPPLQYGSRFGSRFERGIFYASMQLEAAFAECAVYLWLFQQGPLEPGPLANIRDQRCAFSVGIRSSRAVNTTAEPFAPIHDDIVDPSSWTLSQKLGAALRGANTAYCLYASPRFGGAMNTAVFDPSCFVQKAPKRVQNWHLALDAERCRFSRRGSPGARSAGGRQGATTLEFEYSAFARDGRIPHPVSAGGGEL